MGLKKDWQAEVAGALEKIELRFESENKRSFQRLRIMDGQIILNLVSLKQDIKPESLLNDQHSCLKQGIQVIHLWEDIWLSRKDQVLSRIRSLAGLNQRVYGRATRIHKISKQIAEEFLDTYHIQGYAGGRYSYGLFYKEELVAVAVFSHKRRMKDKGENYMSSELVRFAAREGITVTGGMTKLIRHYLRQFNPNDLMSYADRDWSTGNAYRSAGFQCVGETPPSKLYLDIRTYRRYFKHRIPANISEEEMNFYIEVSNTGNLKFILYQ